MNKIYVVVKNESGKYEEEPTWYSVLAAFDMKENAKKYLQEYEKTAPKEAYYTSYSVVTIPLFLSRKTKIKHRPKQNTFPIGDIIKLKTLKK